MTLGVGCGSRRAMPRKKESQRQSSKTKRASPPKRNEPSSNRAAEEGYRAYDERAGRTRGLARRGVRARMTKEKRR